MPNWRAPTSEMEHWVTRREREVRGRGNLAKLNSNSSSCLGGMPDVRHNVSAKNLFSFLKLLTSISCSLIYQAV